MPKRPRRTTPQTSAAKRTFHTKQKPKPRYVSKAHLQEQREDLEALDSAPTGPRPAKKPGGVRH